jgi:ech hydrogenase subunit A
MGKLLEIVGPREHGTHRLTPGEAITLYGLSAGTFLACLFFPLISTSLIEPYVVTVYGKAASLGQGNIIVMTLMMLMVMLFPLSFLNYGRGVRVTDAYLGGANLQSSVRFLGSANQTQEVQIGNYYLRGFFSEAGLSRWGVISSVVLLSIMFVITFV